MKPIDTSRYKVWAHQLECIEKGLDAVMVVMRSLEAEGSPLASVLSMAAYAMGDQVDAIRDQGGQDTNKGDQV